MSPAILHISDLHRSAEDPIGNDELLSTLVADRDRYVGEDPSVPGPGYIVVSGDLIQGVARDCPNPTAQLNEQYDVALDFLVRLTEHFAGGDRKRVVLVPGNHDVAWPIAASAMTAVDPAAPHELSSRAFGPNSELRWSWAEQRVYRIADRARYEERFAHYQAAVSTFYDGLDLPYSVSDHPYYRLHELCEGRIGIAAFNSCAGNDCFAFHGDIPEDALARAHLQLRDRAGQYDLLMAVWHHNVEGAPYTSDYMDIANVYRMMGRGFRLGLHGHQHRSAISTRYIHLPEQVPMAIVSAGSLCAGQRDLPMGVHRQYNIIELSDDLGSARVHVREMAVATVFGPAQRPEFGGKSYIDLTWGSGPVDQTRQAREAAVTARAEKAIGQGRYVEAVADLGNIHPAAHTYPRVLLVRALHEGSLWNDAIDALPHPATADELSLLVKAHVELGQFQPASSLLEGYASEVGLSEPVARDLALWITAQRQLAR